jgi:putative serine protease PepD
VTTTPDDPTPTGDEPLFPFGARPGADTERAGASVERERTGPLAPPPSPPAAARRPWEPSPPAEAPLAPPSEPTPFEPASSWSVPSAPQAPRSGFAPPPAVAPPPVSPGADHPSPPVVVRTPRWVLPVVVLACLALFAGGALTGWTLSQRDDDSGAAEVPTPTGTLTPVADDALVPSGVDEPVAAVAHAVAPSVVQIETNFGLGSGIVIDDDGNILTAAHVIEGATQLRVRLADGTVVPAEIVGTSPETDVGVVRVDARPELVPAVLGVGAEVRVGQLAVAVGSPFGLQQTVTSGIVSALDRPVETAPTFRVGMIQTDASINPGNSGGALADRHGRVIGINDAIRTQGGGNEGVGFAIPIDLAASVAERLIAGEPIRSGFLGVSANDAFEGRPGALVQEVTPGTPAADAGIIIGDLIVSVDGEPVRSVQQLRARILAISPGTEVVVEVVRDGEVVAFDVVLTAATQ